MDTCQLPDRIKRLEELAHDLWWSWNTDARRVFRSLDYPLWRQTAHNPVRMLQLIPPETLTRAMADRGVARELRPQRSPASMRHARRRTPGARREYPDLHGKSIAYFSAEFALHQSLPIYAGGLGVLAGDHCKEASDLGVPLVGVGFMYPQGYFHQGLSPDGWQQEIYERLNWKEAAIEPAMTPDGKPAITRCRSATGRCSSRSGACASGA